MASLQEAVGLEAEGGALADDQVIEEADADRRRRGLDRLGQLAVVVGPGGVVAGVVSYEDKFPPPSQRVSRRSVDDQTSGQPCYPVFHPDAGVPEMVFVVRNEGPCERHACQQDVEITGGATHPLQTGLHGGKYLPCGVIYLHEDKSAGKAPYRLMGDPGARPLVSQHKQFSNSDARYVKQAKTSSFKSFAEAKPTSQIKGTDIRVDEVHGYEGSTLR